MNNNKERLFEMMRKVSGLPMNEIDWEGDFSDVSKECLSVEELKNYLNAIIDNYNLPSSKRTKPKLIIHNKAIPFDEAGEIDVQKFIDDITQYPAQIHSQGNEKMNKSETDDSITYSVGIPALRGLVYDIDNKEFYVVNTCPGAGSCAIVCYARRGRYVIQKSIFLKQTRILNLLLNEPEKFEKILERELEVLAIKSRGKKVIFRWDDAGDFFSKKYFNIAVNITKTLVANGYDFESYAHTKMGDVYNLKDPNIRLSFSTDSSPIERSKVDLDTAKTSEIVPSELFKDLFIRDKANFKVDEKGKLIPLSSNSIDVLKKRIAEKFNVDINTLYTYDEMLKTPIGEKGVMNIIVMPKGEGDVAAQRKDVQRAFLLYH